MKAYCWADGKIDFGRSVPIGAIGIASGPAKLLRAEISVAARHAYDGKTLLVPGVPEAKDQGEGLSALAAWIQWRADKWTAKGLKPDPEGAL